ncbi:hypothetical protein LJB92_04270 [Bacteroidales bacterium OttesenSCG-928-M06]|nr:hypothetical protein [Bacteroidales bacterium OttesenSCG-928-M06]
MKIKKHIILPLVLLIYLAFMAYYFYPGKEGNGELSFIQYYITIGVTLVIIIALYFFQKKKDQNKKKYKDLK